VLNTGKLGYPATDPKPQTPTQQTHVPNTGKLGYPATDLDNKGDAVA